MPCGVSSGIEALQAAAGPFEVGAMDFGGRLLGDDGGLLLIVVERLQEAERLVLDIAEGAQTFALTLANLAGIGAEKGGRRRDDLAAVDGEVERQVMSFDPPSPAAVVGRRAEDRQEIAFRIAERPAPLFHLFEDLLEAHDRCRLEEAVGADAGAEQAEGQGALRRLHIFDGKPLALARDKVPIDPFGIVVGESCLGFLTVVERVHEPLGGFGHFLTGLFGVGAGPNRQSDHSQGGDRHARFDCSHRRCSLRFNRFNSSPAGKPGGKQPRGFRNRRFLSEFQSADRTSQAIRASSYQGSRSKKSVRSSRIQPLENFATVAS